MVASRQVEILFNKGIGRQRVRKFDALAQVIGRTALHFFCTVPAAKHVGAHLSEFSVPEIADVLNGRESFKAAAKKVGRQSRGKHLGSGKKKRSSSKRDIFQTCLTNHVK